MRRSTLLARGTGALATMLTTAWAGDPPPEGGKPPSEIVQAVEKLDLGVITEVEFDDGYWEFDIRADGRKIKLDVDPRTGEDQAR